MKVVKALMLALSIITASATTAAMLMSPAQAACCNGERPGIRGQNCC